MPRHNVVVDVNGVLIDVEAVKTERDTVVVILNQEDLWETLQKIAAGRMPLQHPPT